MLKPSILASIILLGATVVAVAQSTTSGREAQPTTWQLENQSLDKLLDDGWFIQSASGDDGHILILFKGNQRGNNKFMHCTLVASKQSEPDKRLELVSAVSSICQSLN